MRHARIEDGFVVEIINEHPDGFSIDEQFPADFVASLVSENVGMVLGGTWDGINFGPIPPLSLDDAIAEKKAAVNALYNQKVSADFTHGGRTFDAGPNAQLTINHAVAYGQLNAIAGATNRTWVLADNTTATLTWGELRAMASALFERADALHVYARTHKDAIDALASVAAVDAYNITENWGT